MKNTIEAVRYGIETLKVSPNEMFSLIESSKGYNGDEYSRWLANEIIKIAEKDDVGFSQLLVKKFSIISDIIGDISLTINEKWLYYIKSFMKLPNERIISVGFDGIGVDLSEDVNWFAMTDMLSYTPFFDSLPEWVRTEKYGILAKLRSNAVSGKGSELYSDAKREGVLCKNEGALLLYRMCNYVTYNEVPSGFRFTFLASAKYMCDAENASVINHFFKYFDCQGIAIKASELFEGVSTGGEYLLVTCRPRNIETPILNGGLQCHLVEIKENMAKWVVPTCYKRYTRSTMSAFSGIEIGDDADIILCYLYQASNKLYVEDDLPVGSEGVSLYGVSYDNFREVVALYGVWWSMRHCGFSGDIPLLLTGSPDFDDLYYNSLPLFLFSPDSHFEVAGTFDTRVRGSYINKVLDEAEVHFSFEAKELMTVCKGFLDFLGKDSADMTFHEVRLDASHEGLNEAYIHAFNRLMEYVCSIYRRME